MGDLKFKGGDLVQNRVDLLTELDMTYQNRMGFRVPALSHFVLNIVGRGEVATTGKETALEADRLTMTREAASA